MPDESATIVSESTASTDSGEVNTEAQEPTTDANLELEKLRKDAEASKGRAKKLSESEANLAKALDRITELEASVAKSTAEAERRAEEEAREREKTEPGFWQKYQQDKSRREGEATLTQREKNLQAQQAEVDKAREELKPYIKARDVDAFLAEGKFTANREDLIKWTDGSREQMESFCKQFGTANEQTERGKPDTGVTSGGGYSDAKFIELIGNGTLKLDKQNMARAKKLGLVK